MRNGRYAKALLGRIRALGRDDGGAVAIMVALMLPLLAGMAALSVDVMMFRKQEEQLRTAAEAAAAAAVTVLPDRAEARSVALSYARLNVEGEGADEVVSPQDVQIGYWDQNKKTFTPSGENARANAVRVIASRTAEKGNPHPTFFGQVFGISAFNTVAVSAIATQSAGSSPCLIALAPNGTGLKLNSNAKINLAHCGIHVHSADGAAFTAESNAKVNVADADICIRGGAQIRSNSDVEPSPETNCSPMEDPFAAVPALPSSGCERVQGPINSNQNVNLTPCTYRGGLTVSSNATVNLAPGEYVIKDGPLIIGSNATLNGDGVAIYLTGPNAQVIFNSNASVNLTGPETGPLTGFVLIQDRNYGGEHIFNSNAATVLSGAIYFPQATLKMSSNNQIGSTSKCMMIVVNRLDIASNSGVKITPDYSQCPSPAKTRRSRIVG